MILVSDKEAPVPPLFVQIIEYEDLALKTAEEREARPGNKSPQPKISYLRYENGNPGYYKFSLKSNCFLYFLKF